MSRNRILGTLSEGLLVAAVATLLLVPAAAATGTYKTLHKFTGGVDGQFLAADLVFDQTGNLYGTTSYGGAFSIYGGTVFRLTPNAKGRWTKSVLYSFCSLTNCSDGQNPYASLTFDQAGDLYSTTAFGGNSAVVSAAPLADNCPWRPSRSAGCNERNDFAENVFDPSRSAMLATYQ